MVFLHDKHPGVFAQFRKGNVFVKKTTHVFSGIAIVQAHEQNNASVKGDGNPAALRHWMVSGPEMARLIREFQPRREIKQISGITSRGNMHR